MTDMRQQIRPAVRNAGHRRDINRTARLSRRQERLRSREMSSKYLVVRAFRVQGSPGDMGVSREGAIRVFYLNLFMAYFVNILKFLIYPSSTH